ncbi:MAG: YqeG family HAD IIIA-type phosphatase [Planctomycetota bacterium]|jgi:HAD superfamily phosphatase (TIGR01668 family)
MLRLFVPHLRVESVCQLSLKRLCDLGLDALLLDVDSTLKRYGDDRPTAEVAAWLDELRTGGIGLCLVSNGLGGRVRRFAENTELPFVSKALKPFPFRCRAAVRRMGFQPSRTAMVGDQVFADVMAARLAGLTSILVRPIHPEEEPWFTRLKRVPERCLLRWMNVDEETVTG